METASYQQYKADAALEFASAQYYFDVGSDASPALSLLHTPSLDSFDTPESVISHDFANYSPQVQDFNSFAGDVTLFDDTYISSNPMFGDRTLFPSFEDKSDLSLALKPTSLHTSSSPVVKDEPGTFVAASALSLAPLETQGLATTENHAANATSIASNAMPPPSLSRSSSTTSFAVPKFPRGRKRKTSVDTDVDFTLSGTKAALKRRSSYEDEEDEKVALRAKNTEAAARSRARKRAAMEQAENRIRELEEENNSLKAQLAEALREKDEVFGRC